MSAKVRVTLNVGWSEGVMRWGAVCGVDVPSRPSRNLREEVEEGRERESDFLEGRTDSFEDWGWDCFHLMSIPDHPFQPFRV